MLIIFEDSPGAFPAQLSGVSMAQRQKIYRATLAHGKGISQIQQWQLDKQIIETSRNCYCQRFVSMHKGEKQ